MRVQGHPHHRRPRPEPSICRRLAGQVAELRLAEWLVPSWYTGSQIGRGRTARVAIPQILLVPANPLDLGPEELEPLVGDLRDGHASSVDVGVVPQRGYGVTWWEVLVIYITMKGADAVLGHVYQLLLNEITEKVKAWYRERRLEKDNKRPLLLDIRDEEGHVHRALEIQASGEFKDVTEREAGKPLRPRPEAAGTDDEVDPPR